MLTIDDILQGDGETLVPSNHIQQQLTFTLGAGVDFLPVVDQVGMRKGLIEQTISHSQLELNLPTWTAQMIAYGRLLLYLRPDGELYQVHGYPKECYRLEQSSSGQIQTARLLYSYRVREGQQLKVRWVQLRITASTIERSETDQKPNLDQDFPAVVDTAPTRNSLGYVPCVEVLNPPPTGGEPGDGDFDRLAAQIEAHDDLSSNILDNLYLFTSSPLITNREADEVKEAMFGSDTGGWMERESVAHASGFREHSNQIKRRRSRRHSLKKIIGGIDQEDLFQQLNINPVPQDQLTFADQYERQLREALGGILERGIETATESRVVYGKVAATAKRKQIALFKYGLCKIFSMAILAEEALFQATNGSLGLPSLGDRTVLYRVGAVYQPTTRDTLDRSIVSRNLMRQGVNAKEALKFVFPEKAEQEISELVGSGGLPSEYLSSAIGIISQISGLIDPLTGMPIMVDPVTGLPKNDGSGVPLTQMLVPFITNALSYGRQFNSPSQPRGTASAAAESGAINAAPIRVFQLAARAGQLPAQLNQSLAGYGGDEPPAPGSTVARSSSTGGTGYNPIANFLNVNNSPIVQFFRGQR